jgi:hypothetical protein
MFHSTLHRKQSIEQHASLKYKEKAGFQDGEAVQVSKLSRYLCLKSGDQSSVVTK